jgi:hypothetical protein
MSRDSAPTPLKLYWCWTPDHEQDWFVVARSAAAARRFHEDADGSEDRHTKADEIKTLPAHMQDRRFFGWPSEEVILACGGDIEREDAPQVVKIDGKRYVEGDISHLFVTTRH